MVLSRGVIPMLNLTAAAHMATRRIPCERGPSAVVTEPCSARFEHGSVTVLRMNAKSKVVPKNARVGHIRTGPASFKRRRSRTRGRSQCLPHRTYTGPETLTCEVPSNDVIEISLLPVCIGDTYWVESYREVVSTRTALRARKRSGFTCKRASEIRHHRGRSTEEKRKKKNAKSLLLRAVRT